MVVSSRGSGDPSEGGGGTSSSGVVYPPSSSSPSPSAPTAEVEASSGRRAKCDNASAFAAPRRSWDTLIRCSSKTCCCLSRFSSLAAACSSRYFACCFFVFGRPLGKFCGSSLRNAGSIDDRRCSSMPCQMLAALVTLWLAVLHITTAQSVCIAVKCYNGGSCNPLDPQGVCICPKGSRISFFSVLFVYGSRSCCTRILHPLSHETGLCPLGYRGDPHCTCGTASPCGGCEGVRCSNGGVCEQGGCICTPPWMDNHCETPWNHHCGRDLE